MKNVVTTMLSFIILLTFATSLKADDRSVLFDLSGELPDVSPEIQRKQVKIPLIDALDFEFGIYGGMLNVEDFGANYLYGFSGLFHITEDFFLNANYGRSQISDDSFRRFLPLFGDSGKRKITNFNLLLGWNVLSGEMFWSKQTAYTTDFYLLVGSGDINFDNESYFEIIGGVGIKILFTDWLALRVEAKLSEYNTSFLGYDKKSHNIDVTTGLSIFY